MATNNISESDGSQILEMDHEQELTVLESSCSTRDDDWIQQRKKKRVHKKNENDVNSPKAKHARKNNPATRNSAQDLSKNNEVTNKYYMNSDPLNLLNNNETKPPPIYLRNINSYKRLCSDLIQVAGDNNFNCRSRFNDIMIISANSTAYRSIIRYLNDTSADYHCYQLPEDKCYRVVIRNLHHTTPTDDIKTELAGKGYKVIRVHNATHPRTRAPLPLFFVDLKKEDKSRQIFDEKYLQYTKIKVEEPRRRKDLLQCFRCQEFGHSQAYCHHGARCVKCTGTHETKNCPKSREEPAQCTNCGQQHPANYRGCEIYKAIKTLRTKNAPSKQEVKGAPSTAMENNKLPSQQQASSSTGTVRKTQGATTSLPTINPTYSSLLTQRKNTAQRHLHPAQPKTTSTPVSPTSLPSVPRTNPQAKPNSTLPNPSLNHMNQIESFLTRLDALITPLITSLTTLIAKLLPKLLK